MTVVGSAYVEIRALSNKFNKDIQKSLNDSLGGVGKDLGKQVGDDFAAEYKKTVEAKLGKGLKLPAPDTDEVVKKIKDVGKEVDTLHAKMGRGSSAVRNFSRSIKELDNHLLETFGSMFKFGGGFSGLLMTLDAGGAIIGSLLGPLSSLASGFVALTAAIAPAAKAVAILPGLYAALGTAGIAATLSLTGLGKAYSAGAAAAAGGEKEIKKYQETLKKLNPQQQEFVGHLLEHKDAIDDVKNAASEKIFDELSIALDRITRGRFLDILADGLRDAGGALGHVAAKAAQLTGKTFFQRSFNRVMDSNVEIIKRLGRAFVNLAGYFILVADAARPFTEYFAEWVETITGNWLNKARGDFHGLRGSIADGVQVAQQLGDIFGNIGEALGDIGRAARPAGRILLNAFEAATEKFAEFTGSTAGQERMREFFLNITDTVKSLGGLFVSVAREFGKLGENSAFPDMIDTLANSTVPKLAEAMDLLVTAVGDDFIGILDTFAEIGEVMADSGGLESYLEVMQGFLDVIKGILEIPGFAQLAGQILAITGAIKGLSLITKFVGIEWLISAGLPGLKDKAKGVSAALAPVLVALAALEVFRTNPITGTGENPGEGEGSILPKAPKFLDDFTKSLGDPDGLGRGAIREFFAGIEDEITRLLEDPDSFGRGAIKDWWKAIWAPEGLWADIKDNWAGIWEDLGSWVSDEWAALKEKWQNIDWSDVGKNIMDGIVQGIRSNPLVRTIEITARAAINKFKDIFGIKSPSRVFAGFGRDIVNGLINGIKNLPNAIGNIFRSAGRISGIIWRNISTTIGNTARSAGASAGAAFTKLRNNVGDIFRSVGRNAGIIWRGIRTSVTNIVSGVASSVTSRFNKMKTSVVSAFTGAKNGIAKAWSGIKSATAAPVNFVLNTVYNKGIRAWWNNIAGDVGLKSLTLPKATPIKYANGGFEDHKAQIARAGAMRLWAEPETGGEAYIPLAQGKRPRSTAILSQVAAKFGYGLTKYADGGITGWLGDTLDKLKSGVSTVAKIISNPAGALEDLLRKPVNALLSGISGGSFGKIVAELPRKAVGGLIARVKNSVASMGPAGPGGPSGPAMGWKAQWNAVKTAFPNARLHSAFRPGAITAVGTKSMHGLGRAIDISPNMAMFNWIAKHFRNATELIFSPAGKRQLYKGRRTTFPEPTRGDHWDHIHWAMANGGILGKIPKFDQGGILGRGLNLVNNATGGPEALVRPEQFSPKGLAAEYRKLIEVIERAFGASGQMSGAGSQVVSGLIAGMRSGAGAVAAVSGEVANTVIETARSLLQIQSPSRVFRGFGLNIDRGLVEGILAGREELSKAISKTVDDIMDYADDRVDSTADNILESFRRANQKIRAYNRTHANDKDLLQVPTRKQSEERAAEQLGLNPQGIDRARALMQRLSRTTSEIWKAGWTEGSDRVAWVSENFKTTSELLKRVNLGDLARGAEILAARLETAQERLSAIREQHKQMSSGISSGISGALDLTSTSTPTTPTSSVTIDTVSSQVKSLVAKAKTLAGNLSKLVKSGMPRTFVQQIAGLGIDDALAVSKAILAGTDRQQNRLYEDFTDVASSASAVGNIVADQMYGVGISAAQGLVEGLESDQAALTLAAKRLANRLEREVKKALGIKSPSRVFAALGRFLPLGLVEGIQSSTAEAVGAVAALSRGMSAAFTPDLAADASVTGASLSGISQVGRRTSSSPEAVDADGLTAGERAIIAAIEELSSRPPMTINPPPEMDIRTLALLVARELEFKGK